MYLNTLYNNKMSEFEMDEIKILGEFMPRDMFQDFADMISPTLRGFKYGCSPDNFTCPVCLDNSDTAVVITECDHMYHLDCLEKWMEMNNTCPSCRNIMPGYSKTMVEEMLERLKDEIKEQILRNWYLKLENVSKEELIEIKLEMNDLIRNLDNIQY